MNPIYTIAFLLYFISLSTLGVSQNTTVDSLETRLRNHKENDTIRVNLLNDLAYLYHTEDFDSAIAYLNKSGAIADAIGFKKGKAKSLYIKGIAQAVQSNFDQGFQFLNEALQLYKIINYKAGISECYNGIGLLFYDKGEQKQAIEYYKKSVSVSENIGNK
ncbi:MAG: tetratricopeptide repeat protein, partial [Cyclobacteriaceae bacterium]